MRNSKGFASSFIGALVVLSLLTASAATAETTSTPTTISKYAVDPLVDRSYLPLVRDNLAAAFSQAEAYEGVVALTTGILNLQADRQLADVLRNPSNPPAGTSITAVAIDPSKVFAFVSSGRGKGIKVVRGPVKFEAPAGRKVVQAFLVRLSSGRVYYVVGECGNIAYPFGQGSVTLQQAISKQIAPYPQASVATWVDVDVTVSVTVINQAAPVATPAPAQAAPAARVYPPSCGTVGSNPEKVERNKPVHLWVDANDPQGSSLSYLWLFRDGSGARGREVTHTFHKGEPLSGTVVVTSALGLETSCPFTLEEKSGFSAWYVIAPVVIGGGIAIGAGGGGGGNDHPDVPTCPAPPSGAITVSPSTVTAGQNATVSWEVANGTGFITGGIGSVTGSGSRSVTLTATTTFTLTVTGTSSVCGSINRSATVTVTPVTPTFTCGGVSASPSTAATGTSISFTASYSSSPASVSWNFGDGSTQTGGSSINHSFAAAGTYRVVATGTSSSGQQAICDVTVVITGTSGCTVPNLNGVDIVTASPQGFQNLGASSQTGYSKLALTFTVGQGVNLNCLGKQIQVKQWNPGQPNHGRLLGNAPSNSWTGDVSNGLTIKAYMTISDPADPNNSKTVETVPYTVVASSAKASSKTSNSTKEEEAEEAPKRSTLVWKGDLISIPLTKVTSSTQLTLVAGAGVFTAPVEIQPMLGLGLTQDVATIDTVTLSLRGRADYWPTGQRLDVRGGGAVTIKLPSSTLKAITAEIAYERANATGTYDRHRTYGVGDDGRAEDALRASISTAVKISERPGLFSTMNVGISVVSAHGQSAAMATIGFSR